VTTGAGVADGVGEALADGVAEGVGLSVGAVAVGDEPLHDTASRRASRGRGALTSSA
jgi:hypothetical protein